MINTCPSCGAKILDTAANYCPHCAVKLSLNTVSDSNVGGKERRLSTIKDFSKIALPAVIILITVFLTFNNKNLQSRSISTDKNVVDSLSVEVVKDASETQKSTESTFVLSNRFYEIGNSDFGPVNGGATAQSILDSIPHCYIIKEAHPEKYYMEGGDVKAVYVGKEKLFVIKFTDDGNIMATDNPKYYFDPIFFGNEIHVGNTQAQYIGRRDPNTDGELQWVEKFDHLKIFKHWTERTSVNVIFADRGNDQDFTFKRKSSSNYSGDEYQIGVTNNPIKMIMIINGRDEGPLSSKYASRTHIDNPQVDNNHEPDDEEEDKPLIIYFNRKPVEMKEKAYRLLRYRTKPDPCEMGLKCPYCNGSGIVSDTEFAMQTGRVRAITTCNACQGVGHICQ